MENALTLPANEITTIINTALRKMGDILVRVSGEGKVSFDSPTMGWVHYAGWAVSGDIGAMEPAESSAGVMCAFDKVIEGLRGIKFLPFSNLSGYEQYLPTDVEWAHFVQTVDRAVRDNNGVSYAFSFFPSSSDGNTEPAVCVAIQFIRNGDVDYLIQQEKNGIAVETANQDAPALGEVIGIHNNFLNVVNQEEVLITQ